MFKIFRRLPPIHTAAAILFLFVQIASILYLQYITRDIVNYGIMKGDLSYVWSKGLFMLCVSVGGLLGAVFNTLIFSYLSYKLGGQLRSEIYSKAMQFSKHEFDQIGTSALITRNTNDVTQVQTLVEMSLKFLIMAPVILIGGIFMTYLLSPTMALIFIATIPFLIIVYFIIYRIANPLYSKMQKLLDKLNLYFREGLTGARVIRAFGKDNEEYDKYKAINREYTKTAVTGGTIMSFFVPFITLLISLATIGITWLGGKKIDNGTMQIGDIMACVGYSAQILMGFAMMTNIITIIPGGQTSAKRIYEVLDMPLSITDPATTDNTKGTSLVFEHVDFRYQGANRKTLQDISFAVKGGQTLSIIGSTGNGKTSLVNLISRMYDVESGSVSIGGTDVRKLSEEKLHNIVSVVQQKSTLFFGTIRSNMLIAKPDATDDEIWKALDMAQASEFVRLLDNGLDSVVEKGGGNFSGGQKQRLCIARALLKQAAIYVLDDSFSALDFKTDRAVRTSIKANLKNSITVIVAQRISTVMGADMIAVLDNGRLAGLGTHDKLKENNAVYKEIIKSQLYNEEIAI
jgi:ABC-type multidrug transport system fused ATPase/permease subunit